MAQRPAAAAGRADAASACGEWGRQPLIHQRRERNDVGAAGNGTSDERRVAASRNTAGSRSSSCPVQLTQLQTRLQAERDSKILLRRHRVITCIVRRACAPLQALAAHQRRHTSACLGSGLSARPSALDTHQCTARRGSGERRGPSDRGAMRRLQIDD
jgi:hypothetical protein